MKKIYVFVIVLLISAFITSCEQPQQPPTSTPSTEVILSTSNIGEYLNIIGTYGEKDYNPEPYLFRDTCEFTIKMYPTATGGFNNVSITLKVDLMDDWNVSSSDLAFSDNDGYLTTTIKLPAYGEIEETHSLISDDIYSNYDPKNVKIQVVSVSGTFVPAN